MLHDTNEYSAISNPKSTWAQPNQHSNHQSAIYNLKSNWFDKRSNWKLTSIRLSLPENCSCVRHLCLDLGTSEHFLLATFNWTTTRTFKSIVPTNPRAEISGLKVDCSFEILFSR